MPDYQRDPARIQTWNLLIRSQILYSVELRDHFSGCKDTSFSEIHKKMYYKFKILFRQ